VILRLIESRRVSLWSDMPADRTAPNQSVV